MKSRLALVLVLLLCAATALFAAKNTPSTATFLPPTVMLDLNTSAPSPTGVFGDGSAYANGVGGVQCYFGAGGKDVDLVTYSTGRKLHFVFPAPTGTPDLPQSFDAEVDFYGINFYGPYSSMGPNTTAQVHGVLQFHYNGQTYQLDYPALAVYRASSTASWQFSSDVLDFGLGFFSPGFTIGSSATLSLQRKRGNVIYGTFNMPINFVVTTP